MENITLIQAQIIHYSALMQNECPVNAYIIANGLDGINQKREAYLILCGMEFDGLLKRVPSSQSHNHENDDFVLSEAFSR